MAFLFCLVSKLVPRRVKFHWCHYWLLTFCYHTNPKFNIFGQLGFTVISSSFKTLAESITKPELQHGAHHQIWVMLSSLSYTYQTAQALKQIWPLLGSCLDSMGLIPSELCLYQVSRNQTPYWLWWHTFRVPFGLWAYQFHNRGFIPLDYNGWDFKYDYRGIVLNNLKEKRHCELNLMLAEHI